MVSGGVGQIPAVARTLGITLLCFGRLKGSQCDLEGWPESSDDLGSLSQEGLHLEARARGTATWPHTMLPQVRHWGGSGARAHVLREDQVCGRSHRS